MYLQSNARHPRDEYRRYFPDWTRRSLRSGKDLEADHNSYLAGGYAEEFGYPARVPSYRGATLIDAASADDDAWRLVQWAGLHPGYPIRPYPLSVEREETLRRGALSRPSSGVSHLGKFEVKGRGTFVSVADRVDERKRRQLAHRLVAAVTLLLAAGVALRWKLTSLRGRGQ